MKNLTSKSIKNAGKIRKINTNGELVEFNSSLMRWELKSMAWNWSDITRGFLTESKLNYKKANS